MLHILQFLHPLATEHPIRLWVERQSGIHMRLSGRAMATSLLQDLCTLFSAQGSAKHLGLAISKLLIAAQDGTLLYETYAHTNESYTEFSIKLPPADAHASMAEVGT